MMTDDLSVEEAWRTFWLPILIPSQKNLNYLLEDEPGRDYEGVTRWCMDLEQLKKELHDFYKLITRLPSLYDDLTGGLVSKPDTDPDVVHTLAQRNYTRYAAEDILEWFDDNAPYAMLGELRERFKEQFLP